MVGEYEHGNKYVPYIHKREAWMVENLYVRGLIEGK